jgi:hypothetical protein
MPNHLRHWIRSQNNKPAGSGSIFIAAALGTSVFAGYLIYRNYKLAGRDRAALLSGYIIALSTPISASIWWKTAPDFISTALTSVIFQGLPMWLCYLVFQRRLLIRRPHCDLGALRKFDVLIASAAVFLILQNALSAMRGRCPTLALAEVKFLCLLN